MRIDRGPEVIVYTFSPEEKKVLQDSGNISSILHLSNELTEGGCKISLNIKTANGFLPRLLEKTARIKGFEFTGDAPLG